MRKLKRVIARPDYRLELLFEDGLSGLVDIKHRLFGPVFAPLLDPELFARVSIDAYGAIVWPNGADLDPDALISRISPLADFAEVDALDRGYQEMASDEMREADATEWVEGLLAHPPATS